MTRGASSPTLAELNSTHIPSSKRVALSPPFSDHLPVTTSILHSHLTSAVSDSFSSNHSSPRVAFAEKEGFDDLSASFRSLYKSIFGHSVSGGGDFVPAPSHPPPPSNSHAIAVSSSELGSSLPLGASASLLFSSGRNPQFTSLMDSFRDIAESNSWDKLDSSQIQCLMESFKEGEHHKYGLDPDMYADLHASFNKFLSQLNDRFLTSSSDSTPRLSEYNQHQLHGGGGAGGGVMSHASMINHGGMPPPHHPHHHSHHTRGTYGHPQTHAQIDSMLNLHQSSPPPSNYHSVNRTPSPHVAGMPVGASNSHAVVNSPYTGFVSPPGHNPSLGSLVGPTNSPGVPIQSAATDLFDEEDDFDWSKLM